MELAHKDRFHTHFPTAGSLEKKVDALDETVKNLDKKIREVSGKLDILINLLQAQGEGGAVKSIPENKQDDSKKRKHIDSDEDKKVKKSSRSATSIMMSAAKAVNAPSPFDGYQNMSISNFVKLVMTEAQVKVTEDIAKKNPLMIKTSSKNGNGLIKGSLRLIGWCIESRENYDMFIKNGSIPAPGGDARTQYIRKCHYISKVIAKDVAKQLRAHCERKRKQKSYDAMSLVVTQVNNAKKIVGRA